MKKIVCIFASCLLAAGMANAYDLTLIYNNFDGVGDDTGPAFQQVSNGLGSGSADTATGGNLVGDCS